MFTSILKTTLRYIRKHSGYSFLNIMGLTLGITSALFLIIYVSDEVSYDRYHEKADRIYRVSSKITEPDDQFTWIVAQFPFGPQAAADYPEIQSFVRFFNMPRGLYKHGDQEFVEEDFYYADSTLFDIFSYKILKGEVVSAVRDPKKIVLTETAAKRYFGGDDPLGKVITTVNNSFEVTGVIEDVPANSHFRFDAIAARNNLPRQIGSWGNFGCFTYLLLREGIDQEVFEQKIQGLYEAHMKSIFGPINITVEYILEPVTRIHLYSTNPNEPEPTGSITYVYIFAVVAIFLVLIATMNYMNLATARSSGRAREVGLRKVVGSGRDKLIAQFLSESTMLTIISLIISLILIIVLLPKFNMLAGKSFTADILLSPVIAVSLISIIILAGIIGGSYPAFFLSKFSPVTVLKGEITQGKSGSVFRKVLVVIQFAVSVTMIICTLVVFSQLGYLKNMDRGFEQENVIMLQLDGGNMIRKYKLLKNLLLGNEEIRYVTSTNTPMGEGSGKLVFNVETDQGMSQRGINFAIVDHDFVDALGIKMVKGRDFQEDMPSDTLNGVVVNEAFVSRMGWSEPIGKKVEAGDANTLRARIIGVMADYHQTGMYNEVESLLLAYRDRNNIVYVKLSGNRTEETLEFVSDKWKEVFPDQPFEYIYLTERFNRQFEADEKRGFIFTLFTILAILIACLGLFGLASYMVEQRTKEIGIRKVFGANPGSVITLIIKEFLVLIAISVLIALPVAYYFMGNWLEAYVYKTKITVWLLLASALITAIITIITISYKALQASQFNPADSIRTG